MSDITSWERSAANNNSAPPDGAPEGMAPSTVNNTMREMMAAVARNRRQYTGTDSGTDAYQFDGNGDLATDDVVDIDIGAANTTATPTLENTGGAPAGAQSIVTTEGAAFVDMLEARPHRFLWDGTNYVVLDPAGGVVDRGSNSNGEYVRFEDGTQICRVQNLSNSANPTTWTYPAAFINGDAAVLVTNRSGSAGVMSTVAGESTTSIDIYSWDPDGSANNALAINAAAIGAWK